MNPLWLLFIVPISFTLGFFLAVILASSKIGEAESYWRSQYFLEKDSHRGTEKLLDETKLGGQ